MKMDLTVVNPSTWLPVGDPIKGYDSLLWTERYMDHADFVLKTKAIRQLIDILAPETLLTIRGSKEVMMVEKHVIEVDDQGFETLTVTGRSLTSYFNHRVVGEKRGQDYKTEMMHSNLATALRIMYHCFVGPLAWDYTLNQAAYYKKVLDVIPNAAVTDSTTETALGGDGPDITRYLNPGTIDGIIKNLLSERPYGFRILRPPNNKYKITVDTFGIFTSILTNNMPQLCFDVFKGVDRSRDQSVVSPVIFDTQMDDLMSPSYVRTIEGFKSEAQILLDDKSVFANSPQIPSTASGLSRRVLYIDGGQPEEGYTPAEWEAHNIKNAEGELYSHIKRRLIDGTVPSTSRWQFGTHYGLGDYISVRGKYGPVAKAQVVEYIRSDDNAGSEAYPSLVYL